MLRALAVLALSVLVGCASLPPVETREYVASIPASPATALGAAALQARPFEQASGFRLMKSGAEALDARLTLIEMAERSLDLQYYYIAGDAVGQQVLDALRAATARGVRVRLLVDDLHVHDIEPMLMALSRLPNAEVRLFNPFAGSRGSASARLLGSLWEFERINARMHNKLFLADGAIAVVGGRNLGEAYVDPVAGDAFLDLDLLSAGQVIGQLRDIFDAYWNSDLAYAAEAILKDTRVAPPADPERQGPRAGSAAAADPAPPPWPRSRTVIGRDLAGGRLELRWGWSRAYADAPEKALGRYSLVGATAGEGTDRMRRLVWDEMARATREYLIVTPYLIPGEGGMDAVQANVGRGVRIRIFTNSLASTDEPAVHVGYERYRRPMLERGVQLYELNAERAWRLKGGEERRGQWFGLHAKCVVFDRDTVFIGSLNFDPRSSRRPCRRTS